MFHRQIELEMLGQIGVAWVNGPIVAQMGLVEPIDAARERAEGLVKQFYRRLNNELSSRATRQGSASLLRTSQQSSPSILRHAWCS